MELWKFLLSGGLIFIAVMGKADNDTHIKYDECVFPLKITLRNPDQEVNFRLGTNVIPLHYDILLNLNGEADLSHGSCEASVRILQDIYDIGLHLLGMSIDSFKLINNTDTYNPKTVYAEESGLVIFHFDTVITAGNYTVKTIFVYDSITPEGFFQTSYINETGHKKRLIASLSAPLGARKLFPCWDEPLLTATFRISISHSAHYTAVSNMPIEKVQLFERGKLLTRFYTTPVMSTHLLGFVAFEFANNVNELQFRHRRQVSPYLKFAQAIIERVTKYFNGKWKHLREPRQTRYVIIPNFPRSVQVNLGLVIYREEDVVYDEKSNDFDVEVRLARLVAQGVAYQWLGNLASPSWWDSLWLIEGLATYLAMDALNTVLLPYILERVPFDIKNFKGPQLMDLFVIQSQQEALHLDADSVIQPLGQEIINISQINSLSSPSFYQVKASCILRMSQYILTDEVFQKGIHDYMRNNQFNSTNADDFWATMQAAYTNMNILIYPRNMTIRDIMMDWTMQRHYPILEVTRINSSCVRISAETIAYNDTLARHYYMPVSSITREEVESTPVKTLLIKNFVYPVDYSTDLKDGWIIFNLERIGYYRVNYDYNNWHKISIFLDSDNYTMMHVINRAQIIDDAFHFVITDRLKFSTFVEIMNYLHRETNFAVWYPMFKAFEYMSSYLPFEESAYMKYKLQPTLDTIFFQNRGSIDAQIFSKDFLINVERWRCAFGSTTCLNTAIVALQQDVLFPNSVLLPEKEWTYCTGLMGANETIVQGLLNANINIESYIYKVLHCCKNPKIINNYIDVIIYHSFNKTANYQSINVFYNIIARHVRNDAVFHHILEKFWKLKPAEIHTYIAYAYMINHIYSKEQLAKLKEYIESKMLSEQSRFIARLVVRNQELLKLIKNCPICISKFQDCVLRYHEAQHKIILHKISLRLVEIDEQKEKFQHFE